MKEEKIIVEGTVTKLLGNIQFKVEIKKEYTVTAYLSGNLRRNHIRIVKGDKVRVEISPYDLTKGRITYRLK